MAGRASPTLHDHLLWASWLLPALIFLMILFPVSVVHRQNREAEDVIAKDALVAKTNELSANLEHHLNSTLYLGNGLVSYIESQRGQFDPNQFEPWVTSLIKQSRHLRNIGIAPGNHLRYVYPEKGNEKAIGLYYPDNPVQWQAIQSVIDGQKPTLTGPVNLAQGGLGFILRAPVFVDAKYWGLVSIVLNADSLLKEIQDRANTLNIQLSLFSHHDGQQAATLFGEKTLNKKVQINSVIYGPNVQWLMSATQRTSSDLSNSDAFAFIGIFVSVLVTMLTHLMLRGYRRQVELNTALESSEQRFSQAFHDAPQGMLLVDVTGKILSANAAILDLLGLDHTQIQHRTLASLFEVSETAQYHALFDKIASGDVRNAKLETFLLNQHRARIDVDMSVALLSGSGGHSDRLIVQFHDLRQRLALERMKQDFISTVSHELRTPVTAVTASLMVIASEQLAKLPDDTLKLVQIAERNAKRLQRLVNDLLDFDALSNGKLSVCLADCGLAHLIVQSIEHAQSLAAQKELTIELSSDKKDVLVNADGFRLQQVLDNVLSNAIKFSPSSSRIEVSVTNDDTQAFIKVRDFGPGISAAFQAQLFNRFAQENSGNTRVTGGTGLGLAISKRLMLQMQGDIGVESKDGKGCTFTISLSLANTRGALNEG